MGTDVRARFLTFNIGHLISILVYVCSAAYYVGVLNKTLERHSEEIRNTKESIAVLNKKISEIETQGSLLSRQEKVHIDNLDIRTMKLETAISKIEVLQNDIDWFKKFIIAEQDRKLNAIAK